MHVADRVVSVVAAVAGVAIGGFAVGLGVMRGAKGFHPKGRVVEAVLEVPAEVRSVGSLGRPGRYSAVVRFSDSIGLPAPWPDVRGFAMRVGDRTDVLLSSGGRGPVARFVLIPRFRRRTVMTSLVPFRSDAGPVLLSACPTPDRSIWTLEWARGAGPWHRLGTLTCVADPSTARDRPVRFDPVLNSPAGLPPYRWAARLRRPAYAWSRKYVRVT